MTRLFAAAIAALMLMLPAIAQPPPPSAAQPGPDARAKQWLTLVDDSNYSDGAKQMGAQARKADIAALPALRSPLGAVSSRALKDVKLTATNPGMPAGQYAVVRFDSNFAHRANTVETVTLAMEKGAWTVVGYRID
ncbi:MAG: DUF4019 domain-containing protein [Alphaproteobacteria bacterium]|nr:DUF4019 domain-containing protein [Alphaproteobacteria bacterium]